MPQKKKRALERLSGLTNMQIRPEQKILLVQQSKITHITDQEGQNMSRTAESDTRKLQIMYDGLLRQYDLTVDRTNTLTTQAHSLLSFTGVIETVFLALLITLATQTEARAAFLTGQNNTPIIYLLAGGFITFMITIALAFLAYFERKVVLAPEILGETDSTDKTPEDIWFDQLDEYEKKPEQIPVEIYEIQLMHGITYNNTINKHKYRILLGAYVSFAISLFLVAIVGFYIIAAIA